MRIIVHGQQAFGKSVLEALLERGEDIVGVYCAPDREGRPPDPIKQFAAERGLPVFQPGSYRRAETAEQMESLQSDLCVMAYVTAFVPERVLNVPTHGSIQYHPSLLPRHRGGSSINWPIIWGETKTGLSIFWPDDGLDEGPILMQKEVRDHRRRYPRQPLLRQALSSRGRGHAGERGPCARRQGAEGRGRTTRRRPTRAGAAATWCASTGTCPPRRPGISSVAATPRRVRGQLSREPGSPCMTALASTRARSVQPGEVTRIGDDGVQVATADGQLLVKRVRPDGGKKVPAAEWAREAGLGEGARLK